MKEKLLFVSCVLSVLHIHYRLVGTSPIFCKKKVKSAVNTQRGMMHYTTVHLKSISSLTNVILNKFNLN